MEIKDGYLYFETDLTVETKKKITGHSFADLCGFNPYLKKGDSILTLVGIIKSSIDVKYAYRGDAGEKISLLYHTKKLNENVIYYDESTKKELHYDCFQNYNQCGGIPDIEIPDKEIIVEIKSKSMKDYEKFGNDKNAVPKHELYQGMYYAYLRKYNLKMDYVFFDEETENELFQNQKVTTLKNIKFVEFDYDVNFKEIENLIKECLIYYNKCIREKRIPIQDVSDKVLKLLNLKEFNENEL